MHLLNLIDSIYSLPVLGSCQFEIYGVLHIYPGLFSLLLLMLYSEMLFLPFLRMKIMFGSLSAPLQFCPDLAAGNISSFSIYRVVFPAFYKHYLCFH